MELRLSNTDREKGLDPDMVNDAYNNLKPLTPAIVNEFQGIDGSQRTTIFNRAILEAISNPDWTMVNNGGALPKKYLMDQSDIQFLQKERSEQLADRVLENVSDSVPLSEYVVQSLIVRGLDIISKKYQRLSIFRCHVYDTQTGIYGYDYSFGSGLINDINRYALTTDMPTIAILPMQELVRLYKSGKINVASEARWDRDSIEIHSNTQREEIKKQLKIYRIDKNLLPEIKAAIENQEWQIGKY